MPVADGRLLSRQIRSTSLLRNRDSAGYAAFTGQVNCFEGLPRKSSKGVRHLTVSQSDTGRRGEKPKVRERIMEKELGKLAP
jgi:hypothetical protein